MFTRLKIVSLCFSFVGCSIGLGFPEHASAQSSRAARPAITQEIDESKLVTLTGNTRPEANPGNDRGAVFAETQFEHMLLQLKRTTEQERALQNDPQFQRLSPDRQQQLRHRLQHFSSLPPQQQERVLSRMETWEHLTPEQKQDARRIFGQMQQLPPDRRQMVTSAFRDLRAMPPEQREQVINSEHFKNTFSPQEREMLQGASRLPLAPPETSGEQPAPQD